MATFSNSRDANVAHSLIWGVVIIFVAIAGFGSMVAVMNHISDNSVEIARINKEK